MQKPKEGSFSLKIESLFPDFDPRIIAGLIQFVADHAAIGARAQLGFGLVKTDGDRPNLQPLYECLGTVKGDSQYPELPSLKNIFLAQIQLTNMTLQETFNLKYDLRRRFANNPHLRHFVMGKVNGKDRTAAKVKMSLPYDNGRMRVWGWIPEKADAYNEDWDRDKVVNTIYQHLKQNHKLLVWREMNSFRDTVMPGNNDPKAFLRSLLGLEGEENAT
jgi:CRISPR-associated protein Cmr1